MVKEVDVIIIGAGATGLTAATHLHSTGLSVLILEANGHIGGRCYAVNGIDLGASWLHDCEFTSKYNHLADFDMCKQGSCDSFVDPDVDIILGVPRHIVEEYNKLYKSYVESQNRKTYLAFAK